MKNNTKQNVNWNKVISWLVGIVVLLLGMASFVLSYEALQALAGDKGQPENKGNMR